MQNKVLTWPRAGKRLAVVALDAALGLLATWLAFSLRLDTLHRPLDAQWWVYGIGPALAIPVFVKFGLYRAIFRYTGQAALIATAKAVTIYAAILFAVLVWQKWPSVPRSLGILQPLIFLILVAISRSWARFWLAAMTPGRQKSEGRMLIYGAGTAAVQTATALNISGQYTLLGYLTDDLSMAGRSINGVRVESSSRVAELVQNLEITDILLALTSATRARRNEIIQSLQYLPVHIRTLPNWADLASGRISVQDFRELDVEDLLGRDPVQPDIALLANHLSSQVVLVTGAGGSIGGELCRQIVLQEPKQLLLLDHNEFGLYSIHQELQAMCAASALEVVLTPLLASVANFPRVLAICQTYRPATIYHAAAYKHVPMVEFNPGEGISNNVMGTLKMAQAAMQSGVGRFVLISTDKAVRPTNIMGASKRMAELVLQALANQTSATIAGTATCLTMVRFGNVLGSSGSVVPLFRKQLAAGGPLTVTHPDVTRYFMTIPEAAQLVLQAGAMAHGGDVFLLDMGEPVRIIDLAQRMIKLSGLTVKDAANPNGDIAVEITGLRPGEKLYEELLIGDNPEPTDHERIMKAHEQFLPWGELEPLLDELEKAAATDNLPVLHEILHRCVQGFKPDNSLGQNSVL